MDPQHEYDLIVTIVNRGFSEKVVDASRQAGAEGGTILFGRGTGIRENKRLLGIRIEPEKEIVLTAVPQEITERVLSAIITALKLDQPGAGIAFVVQLKQIAGICHLLDGALRCNPS